MEHIGAAAPGPRRPRPRSLRSPRAPGARRPAGSPPARGRPPHPRSRRPRGRPAAGTGAAWARGSRGCRGPRRAGRWPPGGSPRRRCSSSRRASRGRAGSAGRASARRRGGPPARGRSAARATADWSTTRPPRRGRGSAPGGAGGEGRSRAVLGAVMRTSMASVTQSRPARISPGRGLRRIYPLQPTYARPLHQSRLQAEPGGDRAPGAASSRPPGIRWWARSPRRTSTSSTPAR